MADTGSEVAEGTTRGTTGAIARLLERRFLCSAGGGPREGRGQGSEGDVAITVRCPEDDPDRRAREVLDALDRAHVRTNVVVDDAPPALVVGIPRDDLGRAQRALERLHADGRSGFTLDDVTGLELVEKATGRRTLGHAREDVVAGDAHAPRDAAVEWGTLTFANHPDDPKLDVRHAEAYAEGMRRLGFDAEAREVEGVPACDDGSTRRAGRNVVAVGYLADDREEFVLASTVTLHEVGALADLGAEDPYAGDEASYDRDREWLAGQSQLRRERYGRAVEHEVTAEEYGRMPARERARVAPERIPKEAFGSQSARDAAREQRAAASAIDATREPARSHPSIGERVG